MVPNPGFDVVDIFAGQQSISKAWYKPQHHMVESSRFWFPFFDTSPCFPTKLKQPYCQKTACLGLKVVTEQQVWIATSIKLQWIFWSRQVSCFLPGFFFTFHCGVQRNHSFKVGFHFNLGRHIFWLKNGFVDQLCFQNELLPELYIMSYHIYFRGLLCCKPDDW